MHLPHLIYLSLSAASFGLIPLVTAIPQGGIPPEVAALNPSNPDGNPAHLAARAVASDDHDHDQWDVFGPEAGIIARSVKVVRRGRQEKRTDPDGAPSGRKQEFGFPDLTKPIYYGDPSKHWVTFAWKGGHPINYDGKKK